MDFFNNFRNRMIAFFGISSIFIGLLVILYIVHIINIKLIEDKKTFLENTSKIISNKVADILFERNREILLLSKSPLFYDKQLNTQNIREKLKQIENTYPIYSWIGIADANGIVKVANNNLLEGADVSKRPWFINGSKESFIGDIHEAVLLSKLLQKPQNGEPLRFIDFASPIKDSDNNLLGVVATHINWDWLSQQIKTYLPNDLSKQAIEVFIVEKNGKVIYPFDSMGTVVIPNGVLTKEGSSIQTWSENEEFLTNSYKIISNTTTNLGWNIILRQPISKVFESVNQLHKTFLIIGAILILVNILIVYWISKQFSKPIENLVEIANLIKDGNEQIEFNVSTKISEISLLSNSLKTMLNSLISKKHQLENMNTILEHKVQERTEELEKINQDLKLFARIDALTGINNRLAANERLKEEFLKMKRNKVSYSLALIDIDYFKKVNDNYGHEVGDIVLKYIAQILKDNTRATDFVARFGGEEFIFIFTEITQNSAFKIAEKIRNVVENSTIPHVNKITLSIGISSASFNDENEDVAVKKADLALYKAKNEGRNKVILFT